MHDEDWRKKIKWRGHREIGNIVFFFFRFVLNGFCRTTEDDDDDQDDDDDEDRDEIALLDLENKDTQMIERKTEEDQQSIEEILSKVRF